MRRSFWIASLSSLALCLGFGSLFLRLETGHSASESTGRNGANGRAADGRVLATDVGESSLTPGLIARNIRNPGRTPSETGSSPDAPGQARSYSGPSRGDRFANGTDEQSSGSGGLSGATGDGTALDPLRGTQLSAMFEEALEEGDLATLQGLLLSELTMDGTQFGADDLPALFDALSEVDDFGLQNLLLTHLDRVDVPDEETVSGYLDYLENSEHRMHSKAVFKKLVDLGGDETLHGLSEMVRASEDKKLRTQAAEALGELKDPRAVATLQAALVQAEDPRAARPYAEALARIGGNEAIGSLVDYASGSDNEAALSAIMGVKDPAAARLLAEALNGRVSEAYEKTALRKLQSLANPSSLRDLERYLRQASEPMARLALSAVGRIRDPKAPELLEDYAARERNPKLAEYAMKAAKSLRRKLEQHPREKSKSSWKKSRVKREKTKQKPSKADKARRKGSRRR